MLGQTIQAFQRLKGQQVCHIKHDPPSEVLTKETAVV